jgi:hypothetical protein
LGDRAHQSPDLPQSGVPNTCIDIDHLSLDTYFYMSESTLYLNWIAIQVGQQTIYASEDEPAGSRVQWHPSAHSIYIVKKGMTEIEVRIEREVVAVEVSILKISIDNSK